MLFTADRHAQRAARTDSYHFTCGRCEIPFTMPTPASPPGWDVSGPEGREIVTCNTCLDAIERSHIDLKNHRVARATGFTSSAQIAVTERSKPALIMTASGRLFDLAAPETSQCSITDIAHHLSMICRFGGATRRFYSVAEHSVWVSRRVPPHLALAGLLHDAAGAYVGDVISPLKSMLPDFRAVEARIDATIAYKYGLGDTMHDVLVKAADIDMAVVEAHRLMPPNRAYWGTAADIAAQPIECWSPAEAKIRFLDRYDEIIGAQAATVQ